MLKAFPFLDSAKKVGDWKAHILIGRAMFACRPEQAKLRDLLRTESTKGPRPRRMFLANARRNLPQAKNWFSGLELFNIAQHLRGREFV